MPTRLSLFSIKSTLRNEMNYFSHHWLPVTVNISILFYSIYGLRPLRGSGLRPPLLLSIRAVEDEGGACLDSLAWRIRTEVRGQPESTLRRHCTENWEKIFPERKQRGISPNFNIHISVCDLYIPTIGLPIWLQENRWTDLGNILIAHRYMNVYGRAVSFLGIHK